VILVDTSVWLDHLRSSDRGLVRLLTEAQVLGHPAVLGEIALGQLANRREVLTLLANLPQALRATDTEVMTLIETRGLFGLGIGHVDAHLLAATALTGGGTTFWTRDKRLKAAAEALSCHAPVR
jgi:predicted nucleic acid-binding protein